MQRKEINIGRSDANDIVLQNQTVSKLHAKLVFETDGTLWIYDLDSSNGTFVNGQKITGKHRLQINEAVVLGKEPLDWQQLLMAEEAPYSATTNTVPPISSSNHPVKQSKRNTGLYYSLTAITLFLLCYIAYSQGLFSAITSNSSENGKWKKKKTELEYDINCLRENSPINKTIGTMGDIKKEIIKMGGTDVTEADELEVGLEVKKQMDRQYSYVHFGPIKIRIDGICNKLLRQMKTPKFDYQWHIIDSKEINAFTAGGQIFITSGIIEFAQSDDELACVIGHEIYHNELGHITDKLREMKLANNILGDGLGQIAMVASMVLTSSFNQENETYCDMYGLDLAVKAGYNGCTAIDLWERMSKREDSSDEFGKLFRSHPYSAERASCIHHHIDNNYEEKCPSH